MDSDPSRIVGTWGGPDQPIMLTVYGQDDNESLSTALTPTRALEVAKQLIDPTVTSIKVEQWGEGWPG